MNEILNSILGTQASIINVQESKTDNGFELPIGIDDHCSVRINSTTAMVLGGYYGSYQKSTYFVDLDTLQVTNGPDMLEPRSTFGCAVFNHNQQNFVIVAQGGVSEILNLKSLIWSSGKPDYKIKVFKISVNFN